MGASSRKKQWKLSELNEAVRTGRLTQDMLNRGQISGVRGDPHTGRMTLEREPNDIGQKRASVGVDEFGLDKVQKRTPQQRLNSLMEKVGRGIRESGTLNLIPESVIEEIRLEYKWQEGKEIPAEAIRAILAKYLHVETNKMEEKYNKTVTYSRPSYT